MRDVEWNRHVKDVTSVVYFVCNQSFFSRRFTQNSCTKTINVTSCPTDREKCEHGSCQHMPFNVHLHRCVAKQAGWPHVSGLCVLDYEKSFVSVNALPKHKEYMCWTVTFGAHTIIHTNKHIILYWRSATGDLNVRIVLVQILRDAPTSPTQSLHPMN